MSYLDREHIRAIVRDELNSQRWLDLIFGDLRFQRTIDRHLPVSAERWCRDHLPKQIENQLPTMVSKFLDNDRAVTMVLQRHLGSVENQVKESGQKILADIVRQQKHEPVMTALTNQLKINNEELLKNELTKFRDSQSLVNSLQSEVNGLKTWLMVSSFLGLSAVAGLAIFK